MALQRKAATKAKQAEEGSRRIRRLHFVSPQHEEKSDCVFKEAERWKKHHTNGEDLWRSRRCLFDRNAVPGFLLRYGKQKHTRFQVVHFDVFLLFFEDACRLAMWVLSSFYKDNRKEHTIGNTDVYL